MPVTKTHLQLPTHRCCVSVDDVSGITVFKYGNSTCDFEVFDSGDAFAASDYIVEPLPRVYYGVTFPDDPDYKPY